MSLKQFISDIQTKASIDDILDQYNTQSKKGSIYERLWDIVIKFGCCPQFPNYEFQHLIGNSNTAKLKELKSLQKYISETNVISGNSGGCSDITLRHKTNGEYIFITSKYPKSKTKKTVDYYDVDKIIAMIDNHKEIYKKFKIFLIVHDKKEVLKKVASSNKSSKYTTKYMKSDNILDKNDLQVCFLNFKYRVSKSKFDAYDETFLIKKPALEMRFHQELIISKTMALINKDHKQFLWGCKCRSGKTYMVGGLVSKLKEKKGKLNVLIITPVPTETIPQFTEDLFDKFSDFKDFAIHEIKNSKQTININLSNSNIFVMSKQLLQRKINDNTIKSIENCKLDLIIYDENHAGGTTPLSRNILDAYSHQNTVKVYLTATYNKPLKEWNVTEECQMYWDIEDEQACKSKNVNKLVSKHGQSVYKVIQNFNKIGKLNHDIFNPYMKMPDLHLLTTMFDQDRYNLIKEIIMDSKYGFSFDVLFSLNNDKTRFTYEKEVSIILRYISGSNKEQDFKNGDLSVFGRINKIQTEKNSRKSFTQIWFLPPNNINEISICLKEIMNKDKILKNYDIMVVNSNNTDLAKDIKDEIILTETKSREHQKDGLILLAANMLSIGITLNSCDIVMLLNNTLSSDKVMQQMYRCMTEGDDKKMGFVVDMNISRVLNTCLNYSIQQKDLSLEDKLKYLIENNLINIDIDMFLNKKIDSNKIINKLLEIWKADPLNNLRSLLWRLDNEYITFDNETQKLINSTFTKGATTSKIDMSVNMTDEIQELPTGKNKADDNDESSEEDDENTNCKESEEINISFTKDVLPYIIPLTCILTIKDNNKDFIQMLKDIQENTELLEIFDDCSLMWWNKKDLIEIIRKIVEKSVCKNSATFNISINFKMSLKSLIDRPKELLELINECLKPKEIEKRTLGEVFTPLNFINDHMLKNLENHYKIKYKMNIWEQKNFTWFDPATGMGNFPIAIYYKLMDGLKKIIPNTNERKKHILEKMLYMSEINKKNCYVIKQIFNINGNYKLNLYEGDSLKLNIKKRFGKDKFDIVIGNPPYNDSFTSGGAIPLYNKFIEHYIDLGTSLTFVIPSRWFSSGKGLDNFRNMMLNRMDIAYINHFDDASQIFGNSVDIKGGVNYFLKDENYNGKCSFNGTEVVLNKFDAFVDSKYYNIIDKLSKFPSLTSIYLGRYYGIESNDKNLSDDNKLVKCYVSKQKGFIKYIDKSHIKKDYKFWKVITTRAAHKHKSGFGNTFVGSPNEIHTGSYLSFKVKTKDEAESLLSYFQCKLPNFMLSLRKNSQDISESTCQWIPLPPLDRTWTDSDVYKYYKLTIAEIKLIQETKIPGYKETTITVKPKVK